MRHQKKWRKLGRTTAHYKMLGRHLLQGLFRTERIITTEEKAKEFRSLAERLIHHAKESNLTNYRYVLKHLQDNTLVKKLIQEIAPRFKDRPGGYTRVIKLGGSRWSGEKKAGRLAGWRLGDGGSRVIWELVVRPAPAKEKAKKKKGKEVKGK